MARDQGYLALPVKFGDWTRVKLHRTDDTLVLTDVRWSRRIGAWLIVMTAGLVCFLLLAGGVAELIDAFANTAPNSHQRTENLEAGIGLTIAGLFGLGLVAFSMTAFKMHRRFLVRVDFLRRTCVCKSKLFGWTTRRIEVETNHATWDIETAYHLTHHHENGSGTGCLAVLLLLFGGPIGWIIFLISSSGRSEKTRADQGPQHREVLKLLLREEGNLVATLTLPDEAVAEAFLIAWDRVTKG